MSGSQSSATASQTTGTISGRPLATHVEIHERQQLEIRFNYALGSEPGPQRYTVDAFLFVPHNVGVNRDNYDRDEFYADATAMVRLDAAPLPLDHLADEACPDSPLSRLRLALDELRRSSKAVHSHPLSVQVKLYAYLFTSAVRAELARLSKLYGPALENGLESAVKRVRQALTAYRRTRAAFWPFEAICHQSFAEELRAGDEFMSLYVDEHLTEFVEALASRAQLFDGSGTATRCRLQAAALAREEALYRQKYGYLALLEEGGSAGEYFAYRASLLKKAVHSALYLDVREVKVDTFVRNAVGAAAAALAAIWATALAMKLPGTLAGVTSTTKLWLFMAAVGAYVLKDRIKALTSDLLIPKLRQYDHTKWLSGEALSAVGLGMLHARLRESMRFVSDREVPEEILALRRSQRTVRGAEALAEEVIHYRKTVEAMAAEDERQLPKGYWVRDILRLNVRHFLVRLDEPLEKVEFFDLRRDGFASAVLPKNYHLNLVLKVTRAITAMEQERIEHLKIVLNKEGIVRVEMLEQSPPKTTFRERGLRLPFRLRRGPAEPLKAPKA